MRELVLKARAGGERAVQRRGADRETGGAGQGGGGDPLVAIDRAGDDDGFARRRAADLFKHACRVVTYPAGAALALACRLRPNSGEHLFGLARYAQVQAAAELSRRDAVEAGLRARLGERD